MGVHEGVHWKFGVGGEHATQKLQGAKDPCVVVLASVEEDVRLERMNVLACARVACVSALVVDIDVVVGSGSGVGSGVGSGGVVFSAGGGVAFVCDDSYIVGGSCIDLINAAVVVTIISVFFFVIVIVQRKIGSLLENNRAIQGIPRRVVSFGYPINTPPTLPPHDDVIITLTTISYLITTIFLITTIVIGGGQVSRLRSSNHVTADKVAEVGRVAHVIDLGREKRGARVVKDAIDYVIEDG